MAQVIHIKHPQIPSREETFLTTRYASGTALTVRDNEGWAANDILIIGQPGSEQTECKPVASLTGNTIINVTGALKFNHPVNTPIYRGDYDQISLMQKASGGSYAEIAEGKVNIGWDEKSGKTAVSIAAGVTSDTYKWRFYNTASASYSSYSGELPGTGLTTKHAGYIIELIRNAAKMPADLGMTDVDILKILNRGQIRIDALAPSGGRWWFTLTEDDSSTRVTSIAGTYKYDLTSDFRGMDVVRVLDTNDQLYNLHYLPLVAFDSYKVDDLNDSNYDDSTKHWTLMPPDSSNSIGYFGVHPTPETTGLYFYRRYWRFLPELTSPFSQTLVPLPETLFNWAMYEIYRMREDIDNSNVFKAQFDENIRMLKMIQRRQIGQAEIQTFRGQRGYANLFGNTLNLGNLDQQRESYW